MGAGGAIDSGTERLGWRGGWPWLVLALVLVALDLATKLLVVPWLEHWDPWLNPDLANPADSPLVRDARGRWRYPLVGDWLALMRNLNYGAAFGRLAAFSWLLVTARAAASVLLVVLVLRARRGARVFTLALVLVLAGAVGNLWDNLFARPLVPDPEQPFYPVRDFIDVYFGVWDWHFPTFNVADACITIGALLLLASSFAAGGEGTTESRRSPL